MSYIFPQCVSIRHSLFFFFNDTATTEIYTLSLHDALPIYPSTRTLPIRAVIQNRGDRLKPEMLASVSAQGGGAIDRKSTRLNSSHLVISYAVFCLKKKKLS